jgi:hypothetical protein
VLVHRQREAEPADHLQQCRRNGIDHGIDRDPPEDRVVEVGDEVSQTDEVAGLRHRPILQTEQDAVNQRIAD